MRANIVGQDSTMDEPTGITGWVLAAIGTIVSTLAGLVAMFYRQQITDYKSNEAGLRIEVVELKKRADECESDRQELRIKHAVLEQRVSNLETKTHGQ
jgi:hypothetical protein